MEKTHFILFFFPQPAHPGSFNSVSATEVMDLVKGRGMGGWGTTSKTDHWYIFSGDFPHYSSYVDPYNTE